MGKPPLCIAFLWHMHQPDYGNSETGEVYLPWTRLHAVKDYYDMAALIQEVPGLQATMNTVPSLLDQLVAYGEGRARETYMELTLKHADVLDLREKRFLLRSFFQLHWPQMLFPYRRYKELLDRRGEANEAGEYPAGLKRYTAEDYRDLQVWFNLSWCGNELRRNGEIAELLRKGAGYSEEEKKRLIELQLDFIARIVPFYRQAMESSRIELSVSPYYHPILPLLCDSRSARESLPEIQLPSVTFSYPEDAREQIVRAQRRFQELFGRPPFGMWPSEGSISNAAAALASECGLQWLASDEGVLWHSLRRKASAESLSSQERFSAYAWGDDPSVCFLFRDHGLSDLIGFTYMRWEAEDAVADFLHRLRLIHRSLPDDGRHYVVPVILDGENAWEHYSENGADFLRRLYRGLAEADDLRTVTISEFLKLESHREPLKSITAGSWIYSNLATWIGHPEKNRAWELLTPARKALNSAQRAGNPAAGKALDEMLIAEGSDWFWWYGDDHQTQNAAEFDSLFRNRLRNVYRLLGQNYPHDLDVPIKKIAGRTYTRDPMHTISPRIDGRVSDYFEWLAAGWATPGGGESMHRTDHYLEKIWYGFDLKNFYLRLDLIRNRHGALPDGKEFQVGFVAPRECVFAIAKDPNEKWHCSVVTPSQGEVEPAFAGDRILELAVPLKLLGIEKAASAEFWISVLQQGRELERLPQAGFLLVAVDPWALNQEEWIV
jgi:alpha-amylase/alpha-mannosidase (GH57 family)